MLVFVAWFVLAWLPQFVKAWMMDARIRAEGRRAHKEDKWIYEI